MKKLFLIFLIPFILSCSKETKTNNDCFSEINLNQVVYLNNPEFINLEVIGGNTITRLANRNIIIIRRTSRFQAFDLQCPESDCNTPMTYDGLKLKCKCSKKEYNSINGTAIDGNGCTALEYSVVQVNNNTLQITR